MSARQSLGWVIAIRYPGRDESDQPMTLLTGVLDPDEKRARAYADELNAIPHGGRQVYVAAEVVL